MPAAFGISAIGRVDDAYVQNVKTLDEYYERVDAGMLPAKRGVELSRDDVVRRHVIQKLMCEFEFDFAQVEVAHGVRFDEHFAPDLAALEPLARDGLVKVTESGVTVTRRGRLLVRTIAMQFDGRLREAQQRAQYSKVI